MNKRQKIVIVVAVVLVLAMCLYVPYSYSSRTELNIRRTRSERPIYSPPIYHAGYCWFWNLGSKRLAVGRFIVQFVAISLLAGTAVWLLKTPSRQKRDEDDESA